MNLMIEKIFNLSKPLTRMLRFVLCKGDGRRATGLILLLLMSITEARVVGTIAGAIDGAEVEDVAVFRGIPYAAPPMGEYRWRPPQPVESWEGVRAATEFGYACPMAISSRWPQWRADHIDTIGQSEDCLTLNVWSPLESLATSLPVLVYIHGGTYRVGVSSAPKYDGGILARKGFVVVTINYRIGLLGRFAHPALSQLQANEPLANYGTMDQIAALQWVHNNIESFGGDSGNVTIFGHSAGGVSVNSLMVAPQAEGLFHRAIAQGSGIMIDHTRHISERRKKGAFPASLEDQGIETARHFEIEGSDEEIVRQLRAIPAEQLSAFLKKHPEYVLNPVVDGTIIPDDMATLFASGQQHDVPYLTGVNTWESNLVESQPLIARWFIAGGILTGLRDEDLSLFDDQWTRIGIAERWFQEGLFMNSTRYLAKQMSKVASPAFQYRVSYVQENLRGEIPGAPHGLEVEFLFGNVFSHPEFQRPEEVPLTEQDRTFANNIRAYWLNFARSGNPNGEGLPHWPEYEPETDVLMGLGVEFAPLAGLDKERQDFLEQRALIRRASH